MRLPIQLMPFYGYLQLLWSNPWIRSECYPQSLMCLIDTSVSLTDLVSSKTEEHDQSKLGTPWVPGPLLWTKLRTHQQPINLRFVGSLLGWLGFDDPLDLKNAAIVGPCWAFSKISYFALVSIIMQYPFPLNNLNISISGKTQSLKSEIPGEISTPGGDELEELGIGHHHGSASASQGTQGIWRSLLANGKNTFGSWNVSQNLQSTSSFLPLLFFSWSNSFSFLMS